MAIEKLRDPKTGRFIAGPNSVQNILPAIADDFRQISFSILKLTKLDEEEKKQKKLDETKQRRDQYAEKYKKVKTSPTKVNKIDKQRSIIDTLKDLFGGIFKFLIIGIGIIGLAKLITSSKGIVVGLISFIKNVLLAAVDVFGKIIGTIGSLLSDKDIQKSFIDLMKKSFEFIGNLLLKGFDLFVGLVKDKDVQSSFVEALVATFQAAYDVIRTGFNILWSSLNENFASVVNAITGSIRVISTAIAEGIKFVAEIMSDQRILESIKNVAVAVFGFMVAAFKEDYLLEGGKVKSGTQIFGEWVGEAVALTALLLYWKAKFFKMGLGNFGGVGVPNAPEGKDGKGSNVGRAAAANFAGRGIKKVSEQRKAQTAAARATKATRKDKILYAIVKNWNKLTLLFDKLMYSKFARNKFIDVVVRLAYRYGYKFGYRAVAAVCTTLLASVVTASTGIGAFISLAMLILNLYLGYEIIMFIIEYSKEILNELEKDEKEETAPKPTTDATQEQSVEPTPAPAPAAATTPAMPNSIRNVPVPTSSVVPTKQETWSSDLSNVPAGIMMEKRELGLKHGGVRKKTDGVIVHHTGGNSLQVAVDMLKQRGLSYHYLVDRDGKVVQILPDNLVGWHSYPSNKKPNFNNSNTISISMVAADDTNVTPEQIKAATSLEEMLAKKYSFTKTNAFGHGEVSSGKHPKEGFTIASAIRSGTTEQAAEKITEKSLQGINQNIPPTLSSKVQESPEKAIDVISGEVRAAMRMLEDIFLAGRPSFNDLSTTIIQNNAIRSPGGNLRTKEDQAITFLLDRQTS
jgi:hypothetical protein